VSGATRLLEHNKLLKEIKLLKKQNESFFSAFDSFLGDIDSVRIREKIDEVRESFPEVFKKLESFQNNYDMVTRCCETFFFFFQ